MCFCKCVWSWDMNSQFVSGTSSHSMLSTNNYHSSMCFCKCVWSWDMNSQFVSGTSSHSMPSTSFSRCILCNSQQRPHYSTLSNHRAHPRQRPILKHKSSDQTMDCTWQHVSNQPHVASTIITCKQAKFMDMSSPFHSFLFQIQ